MTSHRHTYDTNRSMQETEREGKYYIVEIKGKEYFNYTSVCNILT